MLTYIDYNLYGTHKKEHGNSVINFFGGHEKYITEACKKQQLLDSTQILLGLFFITGTLKTNIMEW